MREFYHRSDDLSNEIINTLYKEFEIEIDLENNTYVPITLLKNNPIHEVVEDFKNKMEGLQLVTKEPYTIGVLIIPKQTTSSNNNTSHAYEAPVDYSLAEQVKEKTKNLGLVASSWEIAENLKRTKIAYEPIDTDITFDFDDLPTTKEELLGSDIGMRLNRIANGAKYPTRILAQCLQRMLADSPELSPEAIHRIALMLDLTNTFYRHNYPRYAFCVYAIIHEISLALLKNTDQSVLEREFATFQAESYTTLLNALGLNENKLQNSTFFASSSTSGVSACTIATRIASKMQTEDGHAPKVKIFKPCYFELPNISTLEETQATREADIFMISAGPIVNPEGLTPGIDINHFVKRTIISKNRTKPTTIIIDATTTLYKNMELEPEVQRLVEEGKLSIIVQESHQKFGLIHSDQAQYGRVFGWCSKAHIPEKELQIFQEHSKDDFNTHVDIRIGSFISTRCQTVLEDIKRQHFTNGAILRNILIQTSLVSKGIVTHKDMLHNLEELYFLNDEELQPGSYSSRLEKAAYGVIDYRSSFGHYSPTTSGVVNQRRLSPDASDELDSLVQACHIRLAQDHSPASLLNKIIRAARNEEQTALPLEEQILVTGIIHYIISNIPLIPTTFQSVRHLDAKPTAQDISDLKLKNQLIFIEIPGAPLKIGYCSFDNLYKELIINDPKMIEIITNQTYNLGQIKTHLSSLQTAHLPKDLDLPLITSLLKRAFEDCPLLRKRQYGMKINQWLNLAQKSISETMLYSERANTKDHELSEISNKDVSVSTSAPVSKTSSVATFKGNFFKSKQKNSDDMPSSTPSLKGK